MGGFSGVLVMLRTELVQGECSPGASLLLPPSLQSCGYSHCPSSKDSDSWQSTLQISMDIPPTVQASVSVVGVSENTRCVHVHVHVHVDLIGLELGSLA